MNANESVFLTDTLPAGGTARLAVFGKHPAAADHLEDAGLTTGSLVQFKQGFYVDGLGEILARRRWEKELETPEIVPYGHGLIAIGPGGWLLAFFAASSDAKGRRQYPLVTAAHIAGFRAAARAGDAGEILRQTLRHAQGASSVDGIRSAQVAGQRQLEDRLAGSGSSTAGASVRLRLLEGSGCGPESDALARVLHSLSPQGAGTGRARIRHSMELSAFHALLWAALVRSVLHLEKQTISVTWQHGDSLADITLGEPGSRTLQNLFALETAVPLTACVPYSIEEEQQDAWSGAVQAWLDAPEILSAPEAAPGGLKGVLRSVGGFFRKQKS